MNIVPKSYDLQALWASLGQVAQAGIALLGLAVLVRFLGAEAYGLYAVAFLCVGVCDILVGGHAGDGLVSVEDLRPSHIDSLFWLLVGLASLASACLWATQDIIAQALSMAGAGELIGFASGLCLLTALTTVPNQLLVRRVDFAALSRASAFGAIAGTGAGILAASVDVGPLSLVIMEYVRRITIFALNIFSSGWRPGFAFNKPDAIEIGKLARGRIENQAVQYLSTQALPRALIGAALGPSSLGAYVIANRLLDQLNGILSGPISAVLLPAFAKARHDKNELRRIMKKAIHASTITFWPALLGMAAVAPLAVSLMLGSKAQGIGLIVQILIIGSLRTPLSGFTTALFAGLGDHATISRLQWISLFTGMAFLLVAIPWGLTGMVCALAVRQWAVWPISAAAISQAIGFPSLEQLCRLLRSAAAPTLMGSGVTLLSIFLPSKTPANVELLALISAGLVLYPIALMVALPKARKIIPEAGHLLLTRRPKQAFQCARALLW